MIKRLLKGLICILLLFVLYGCTNQRNPFYVVSDYDFFKDAGDMGFYKKGELYGFIHLNGDTAELEPFTLDEKVSEAIILESIECLNGMATFTIQADPASQQVGFMDLHGNILMNSEWIQIRAFNRSGYASVADSTLHKYIIIDTEGRTIRDTQSYIEVYPPNPDIFICGDTLDVANSESGYYVLDKDLNPLLDDLEVYYQSGKDSAHTRQYTIFGDSEKFIYKKNDRFYLYSLINNEIISEYDDYADLLKNQKVFIEKCEKAYVDSEYPVMTDSYNSIFIRYEESKGQYLITNENGKILFDPGLDVTGLTYLKGKVIQGVSKSTGNTVVIFNRQYKKT